MPAWVFLLIAVASYMTGFVISGAIFSHTMSPSTRRVDLVTVMIIWPVALPCYGVYRSGLAYVEFLERTLYTRGNAVPKNVTKISPRQVTHIERWENE